MRRLLCWLGRHDYYAWVTIIDNTLGVIRYRRCRHCKHEPDFRDC